MRTDALKPPSLHIRYGHIGNEETNPTFNVRFSPVYRVGPICNRLTGRSGGMGKLVCPCGTPTGHG